MKAILGERIHLRPTTADDLPDLLQLWNDGRIMRWVDIQAVWTEPSEQNLASRKLYTHCGLKPRPADLEPFESYWEITRDEL